MNNVAPSANSGFVVVTHVYPEQSLQNVSPSAGFCSRGSSLGKFLKGEPIALGTVQIMTGIIIFLFGIVSSFFPTAVSVFSGIMFWGAFIYITAGALTVRASKKLNPCLVKASLGMNIVSTIISGSAIVLHSLDFVVPVGPYYPCEDDGDSYDSYDCWRNWESFMTRARGIVGVMLLLSLLEFVVSISVSAFACKATCSSSTDQQVVYVGNQMPPPIPTSQVSAPSMFQYQAPYPPSNGVQPIHPNSVAAAPMDEKPAYMPPVYTAA